MSKGVATKLADLKLTWERFAALLGAGNAEREKLIATAATLKAAVAQMAAAAEASEDSPGRRAAIASAAIVLTAEVTGSRFFTSLDPVMITIFNKDAAAAGDALSTLDASASPEVKSAVPPVANALMLYVSGVPRGLHDPARKQNFDLRHSDQARPA